MLSQSKDHHLVIEQQPAPSPNATKASDIFLIHVDDEMFQHINHINKSGPQDIVALWRKKYNFKYAHKTSCVL